MVIDSLGCTAVTKSVTITEVASVITNDLQIKVYPNPVSGIATIYFNSVDARDVQISLIDVSGRLVYKMYEGKIDIGENSISFDLSGVGKGFYFVEMVKGAGRGEVVSRVRLVHF
ncbi:MAG: T9SS type A sorting domain-containing protein [Bacteroidetes bacterium]|nr:T9SS type A sorting domain-containing protein [Bacteroidota bacterium]